MKCFEPINQWAAWSRRVIEAMVRINENYRKFGVTLRTGLFPDK